MAVAECCPGEAAGKGEGADAAETAREDDVRAVAADCRVQLVLRLAALEVVPRQRSVAVERVHCGDAATNESEDTTTGQIPATRDVTLVLRSRGFRQRRCSHRSDERAADEDGALEVLVPAVVGEDPHRG